MIDLRVGDSLQVLKELEDNSVDSVVTDPPYGLKFMSKKWDYDVPTTELWKEVIRVLKPGGHLLSFSSSRTYHRMAVAVEDAGFEIRDQIMWVYGSGFPKSHNIGKSYDKKMGNGRVETGKSNTTNKRREDGTDIFNNGKGMPQGVFNETKGTSPYEGWGTALKPAHEPIVLARKPFKGTVVDNVIKHGTGGINIDKSRVEYNGEKPGVFGSVKKLNEHSVFSNDNRNENNVESNPEGRFPANFIHDGSDEVLEHFPHTNKSIKSKRTGGTYKSDIYHYKGTHYDYKMGGYDEPAGSAARFFYCAKVSKSERNVGCEELDEKDNPNAFYGDVTCKKCDKWRRDERGKGRCICEEPDFNEFIKTTLKNNHPTVKPVKLMSYLVNLITPEKGIVLDPFMGSGSTGMACKANGFNFIGIDLDEEYVNIAKARIDGWE